jgi:adsorption protein B
MNPEFVIPALLVGIKILLAVLAVFFLVGGLDELFIDIFHFIRSIYRQLFVLPKYQPLTEAKLLKKAEQPIVVMIPAWDESKVIERMLDNFVATIRYKNYHIFTGVYPNDEATQRAVSRVMKKYAHVHMVITKNAGPTCKADCLNNIYQGIARYEASGGVQFAAFVMNDSEDMPHPLYLHVFNYLIPRKDMVQLPVLPMPVKWHHLSEGHYIDEFSESHAKNILVREKLARSFPSAGTGTGFSRLALQKAKTANGGKLFNTESLTEDYDFSLKLGLLNLKQAFVLKKLPRTVTRRTLFSNKLIQVRVNDYIAIRSHFPPTFERAVRQKSRWIIGIAFQGWKSLGWRGNLFAKYMLFRDRKCLIANHLHIMGYVVVVLILALRVFRWLSTTHYRYPPLIQEGTILWYILLANLGLFSVRFIERMYYVYKLYDLKQALLSAPRVFWGNFLNFAATVRAYNLYFKSYRTGKTIAWDKTSHDFPDDDQLPEYRNPIWSDQLGTPPNASISK